MNLYDCMGRDTFWVALTVLLDVTIAAGYVLIALHWSRNARLLPDVPAKRALSHMRNIFVFCGICGYIFIPIKMIWPAWRLYDFFMIGLAWYTWRYAWGARELKVVYSELGRVSQLTESLAKSEEESRRKSQFFNALSHDLRTPLNGLVLQTNLAEVAHASNDRTLMASALEEIKASARQTANLLDGLLDIARLETSQSEPDLQPVNLCDLIAEIDAANRVFATERGLAIRTRCPKGLILQTDARMMRRILTNLVHNAIKFTTSGEVRIEVETAALGVEIHVIDTGIGIPQEHHERLFEDFFQLENQARDPHKGFGLGLAIARRLARQLGGDVRVQGAPGRGSCFTVALIRNPADRPVEQRGVAHAELVTSHST